MDLFTSEFKRLKAKNPPPNLDDVIDLLDFENPKKASKSAFECVHKLSINSPYKKQILGLKPCTDWNVFKFDRYPGFMVIQNPFVDGYQKYWVTRCLQDFPSDRENVTNLSALGDLSSFNLWQSFVELNKGSLGKDEPLRKLRWTTLGYHYNWTTKEYYEDQKSEFPHDIQCLTQFFSDCLELGPFKAEAAIVNYYHHDSTLAGHTDHSELDHNAPLFSISFGQTAVFMLGGLTKAEKPMSVFLRSGDVCVMSGPCRLAYHAVPKIFTPSDGRVDFSCFALSEHLLKISDDQEMDSSHANSNNNASPKSRDILHRPHTNIHVEMSSHVPSIPFQSEKGTSSQFIKCAESKDPTASGASHDNAETSTACVPLSFIDTLNKNISHTLSESDWKPFGAYLQSSRINLNVRQVFHL